MISGSAPLARPLLDSMKDLGLLVLEAYGLSENAIPIATNRSSDYRFGSVGKPLYPNQIRLAADGEVEVKSIGTFLGYIWAGFKRCVLAMMVIIALVISGFLTTKGSCF